VRRGIVRIVGDIERFTAEGAVFRGGREAKLDAVVLATGYRPKVEDFLEGAGDALDARGYPRSIDAGGGLFFLGFVNPPTGFLRQIAIDAKKIAKAIVGS
jgi:putative flavoprotein involved in K+ transport